MKSEEMLLGEVWRQLQNCGISGRIKGPLTSRTPPKSAWKSNVAR